jgi:hypothetical protein
LATVVQYKHTAGGSEKMIRHIYFSHYQAIRGMVTALVTLGVAMLLSYLILLLGV